MSTPYPSHPQTPSSTQSHPGSHSSLASSANSSTGLPEHNLCEISSSLQHLDLNRSHETVLVGDLGPANRPLIPIIGPDIRLARLRHNSRNDTVPEPQSPPHRDDFPGKPAEGEPRSAERAEYGPVDGPRWSDEEYRRFLAAAMSRRFPPALDGVAEARERSERRWSPPGGAAPASAAAPAPRRLEGFARTLDLLKEIKRGNRAEFGAWSDGRGLLERALADKAARLRAEHALHVERVHEAHRTRRHRRVTEGYYRAVRGHHLREMEHTLRAVHEVAGAAAVLYAERAAVAQGCVPRHGENWGKLDMTACEPTAHVHALLPEFAPPPANRPPSPPPDDFAPTDLPLPAQPGVLDAAALAAAWRRECRPRLAALHGAAFRGEWYEVLERSRAGAEHARRVLDGGCVVPGGDGGAGEGA